MVLLKYRGFNFLVRIEFYPGFISLLSEVIVRKKSITLYKQHYLSGDIDCACQPVPCDTSPRRPTAARLRNVVRAVRIGTPVFHPSFATFIIYRLFISVIKTLFTKFKAKYLIARQYNPCLFVLDFTVGIQLLQTAHKTS